MDPDSPHKLTGNSFETSVLALPRLPGLFTVPRGMSRQRGWITISTHVIRLIEWVKLLESAVDVGSSEINFITGVKW
jgi:hypothetical protein